MKLARIASAVALSSLALASAGARADIVNIDAKSSTGTTVTLQAGTYALSWAGIAGGGLYDAWSYATPVQATKGYRDAFSVSSHGVVRTFDIATPTPFAGFDTPLAALGAFQSASSYVMYDVTGAHSYTVDAMSPVSSHFTFTLSSPTSVTFTVPDYKFDDNTGGVSLSITAVPETETYALMLAGLAAVTVVARRRKSNAV